MAINLGWISFGLNPDTRRLDEARRRVEQFGTSVDSAAQKAANSLARLSNVATLISGPLGGVAARLQTVASLMGRFGPVTAGVVTGVAIAGYAFLKLGEQAVNATKQVQRLELSLTAVAGASALTGRSLEALRAVADRNGQAVTDIAGSYSRLMAASKGTNLEGERIKKVFEQVTGAGAKLGLTSDEVSGTLRALEQIMSKGTVQAEELRGQLGDRLPGAFNIMADALGVSTQELNKLMKQGKLTSDALVPFADELARKYGVDLTKSISTVTAAEGRLGNAWLMSMAALDKAIGFSEAYKAILELTTAALNGLTYILTPFRMGLEKSGKAIQVNQEALGQAAKASKTFRQELQAQITIQRNAARVALSEATAQLTAAKAKQQAFYDAADALDKQGSDGMWETLSLMGQALFNETYNSADAATKKLDATRIQLTALDNQLTQIDALMKSMGGEGDGALIPIGEAEASAASLSKIAKALRESSQAIAGVRAEYEILQMNPAQQKFAEMQQRINEQVSVFKDRLIDAKVPLQLVNEQVAAYTNALTLLEEKQYQLQYLPNFWTALSETFSQSLDPAMDMLIDTWIEGGDALKTLADIGKMVATDLIKSFAQLAVLNPIKNLLSTLFGGGSLMPTFNPLSLLGLGGGTNPLSSWTNPALGQFAGGGSFKIPGGGQGRGMDSQLVQFWGKPGEEVSIGKTGHGSNGGSTYVDRKEYYLDARGAMPGVEQMIIDAIKAYDNTAVVRLQRDSFKGRSYRKPGVK